MDIRDRIKFVLNETYGDFKTDLESEYREKIINTLINENINGKKEWVTYNQVILELKHNLKDNLKVSELLYRLTDKEHPTKVCIDVIKEIKIRTPELDRLYYKIKNFQI